MNNVWGKPYTPIHADKELTDEWWLHRGFQIGKNLWYNAVRDGSGRFKGYCVKLPLDFAYAETVQEAEFLISKYGDIIRRTY